MLVLLGEPSAAGKLRDRWRPEGRGGITSRASAGRLPAVAACVSDDEL
jgi:hypothetical protein